MVSQFNLGERSKYFFSWRKCPAPKYNGDGSWLMKEFEPRTFRFHAQIFNCKSVRGTRLRINAKQGCWNTITGVTVCYKTAPSLPLLSLFFSLPLLGNIYFRRLHLYFMKNSWTIPVDLSIVITDHFNMYIVQNWSVDILLIPRESLKKVSVYGLIVCVLRKL